MPDQIHADNVGASSAESGLHARKGASCRETALHPPMAPAIMDIADRIPGYSRHDLLQEMRVILHDQIFYSQSEIANKYGVSLAAVKKWAEAGDLVATFHRPGGIIRYTEGDLLRLEKARGLSPVKTINPNERTVR